MKQYTKQSVTKGEWLTSAECRVDGTDYAVKVQMIDGYYQDHFAIYINGKRQRKTYFGEFAHHDVARAYNDLVGGGLPGRSLLRGRPGWQNSVFGDEL